MSYVICVASKPPDQLQFMMSFYFIFDKLIKTQFNGFDLVGKNSIRDILFQEIRYQIRNLSVMERCIRINAENGQKVGFKITKTVVTDVNPGGLADNAGLRVGDRLVKVRLQRTQTASKADKVLPWSPFKVDGYSCRDMKPENIINFIKVSGSYLM